jgi:hypothetical protein
MIGFYTGDRPDAMLAHVYLRQQCLYSLPLMQGLVKGRRQKAGVVSEEEEDRLVVQIGSLCVKPSDN